MKKKKNRITRKWPTTRPRPFSPFHGLTNGKIGYQFNASFSGGRKRIWNVFIAAKTQTLKAKKLLLRINIKIRSAAPLLASYITSVGSAPRFIAFSPRPFFILTQARTEILHLKITRAELGRTLWTAIYCPFPSQFSPSLSDACLHRYMRLWACEPHLLIHSL